MDIREIMRKAFSLGQTYWYQADSESYSQNKKADVTLQKFEELLLAATIDSHQARLQYDALLEALEDIMEEFFLSVDESGEEFSVRPIVIKARAAIAAAKGE